MIPTSISLLAGIPRDHGSDTVIDEIDVVDPPVMRLQLLADWKIDGLQVRFQQTEIRRREARERVVYYIAAE